MLVRPSAQIEGEWLAEVPELGYTAQGRSPAEAIAAAREGAGWLVDNNLELGLAPVGTVPFPSGVWVLAELIEV